MPLNEWQAVLDPLLDRAIRQGVFSAAALLVGHGARVLFATARGHCYRQGPRITRATRFDLASLTKPLVTASILMRQASRGSLSLEDPLTRFLPAGLVPGHKKDIRLHHLLSHSSGLPAYRPYFRKLVRIDPRHRRTTLRQWLLSEPLTQPPGQKVCYSDLGFMLLALVLEQALGRDLNRLSCQTLAECPEAAANLGYIPLATSTDPEMPPEKPAFGPADLAATERCPWRKRLLLGEVHDENAHCLNGVAGHAGLFGTARGVWAWLDFLCAIRQQRIRRPDWNAEIVRRFWSRSQSPGDSTWALGFDTPDSKGSSAGSYFSPASIGHLGFTGTSFWLDPEQDVCIILLTNRVHPSREDHRLKALRPLIHDTTMRIFHAN